MAAPLLLDTFRTPMNQLAGHRQNQVDEHGDPLN